IFTKQDDETNQPLLDVILDKAGQKGTGKWTSINALELGVPLPLITESVFARCISYLKEERTKASKVLYGPEQSKVKEQKEEWIETVKKDLLIRRIFFKPQEFPKCKAKSNKKGWNINLGMFQRYWVVAVIFEHGFYRK